MKFLGRLVYGRYEADVVAQAFQELGYSKKAADSQHNSLRASISKMRGTTTVTRKNAPIHLVLLLAKYCIKFEQEVSYGGNTISRSKYYLDTMGMVHDKNDLKTLCDLMIFLLDSVERNKPDVIIAPKGGNPLLAAQLATYLEKPFIIVKSPGEKSKVTSSSQQEQYHVNYEGSSCLSDSDLLQTCALIDCNLSGGSQLKSIIKELNKMPKDVAKINKIEHAYVLFRVDDRHQNVEDEFRNLNVSLHRFFDLDESIKDMIYGIKREAEQENRAINPTYSKDWDMAREIVAALKKHKKYFYRGLDSL